MKQRQPFLSSTHSVRIPAEASVERKWKRTARAIVRNHKRLVGACFVLCVVAALCLSWAALRRGSSLTGAPPRIFPSITPSRDGLRPGVSLPIILIHRVGAGTPLIEDMVGPVLRHEAALCSGSNVSASLIVVTELPGTVLTALFSNLQGRREEFNWIRVPADAARRDLGVVPPRRAAACISPTLTIIPHKGVPADAAMIETGLAAAEVQDEKAPYFLLLSSFLRPLQLDYVNLTDVAEARRPGLGLLASLLRTAQQENEGRVAMTQCTILGPRGSANNTTAIPLRGGLNKSSAADEAALYEVRDKGAVTGAFHAEVALSPFLSRHMYGYPIRDQRAGWESAVDAASHHCALVHRGAFDGVGGLSGIGDIPVSQHSDHRCASLASDAAGWWLSLRLQEAYPDWEVWGSRGAVCITGADASRHLQQPVLLLHDAFGRAIYDTITRLQRRRVAQRRVPWSSRSAPLHVSIPAEAESLFPPLFVIHGFYEEACSGLNKEAMGYAQPLLGRAVVQVKVPAPVCRRHGDGLLRYAYLSESVKDLHPMYHPSGYGDDENFLFWRNALLQRGTVDLLHMKPTRFSFWEAKGRSFASLEGLNLRIARSLSETNNLSASWMPALATATDKVWATSAFFYDLYQQRGVAREKLRVVPEAVDVYTFDPFITSPLPRNMSPEHGEVLDNRPQLTTVERSARYVFLSNFKWEHRKGWDILLKAYWDAFGPAAPPEVQEKTTLILKVSFSYPYSHLLDVARVASLLRRWAGDAQLHNYSSFSQFPHLIIVGRELSEQHLVSLYATADAFVLPTRGEGWGLPVAEAMSMGLPVIVPVWGGIEGIVTKETGYSIPIEGLRSPPESAMYTLEPHMQFAEPSIHGTAELLRYVYEHQEEAREVGRRARLHARMKLSEEAVGDVIMGDIVQGLLEKWRSKMAGNGN